MKTEIFYPKTRLFPTQPQILHQLALQFFLMADRFEEESTTWDIDNAIIAPYGSYFDVGQMQAALYRYRAKQSPINRVVVIAFAELDETISLLTADYQSLHTFLGEFPIDSSPLQGLPVSIDNELFGKHADPIVCQLPFLRSYRKIDTITPVIINTKKTDLDRTGLWSALTHESESTGYVLCHNDSQLPHGCTESFAAVTGQHFFCFYSPEKNSFA